MFIDASALTAMLTHEDEARELLARVQQSTTRLTSPLAVWEAAIAIGPRARSADRRGGRSGRELSRADRNQDGERGARNSPRSTPSTASARADTRRGSISGTVSPTPAPDILANR